MLKEFLNFYMMLLSLRKVPNICKNSMASRKSTMIVNALLLNVADARMS